MRKKFPAFCFACLRSAHLSVVTPLGAPSLQICESFLISFAVLSKRKFHLRCAILVRSFYFLRQGEAEGCLCEKFFELLNYCTVLEKLIA
jgi:hypothetical protein